MAIVGIVVVVALGMFVIELVAPGRPWKAVAGWWGRALMLNLVQVAAVFVAGITWDNWFEGWALWRAETDLGFSAGAMTAYLIITFIYYWWHRMRHQIPLLWRVFHQVHHSPQRIEIITTFYKHPVEIFANSMLSSAIVYVLCGLSPEAASLTVVMTGFAELFYHWNVKTPHWIGFLIQRPESHCVHHQKGWHSQNFADLPVWDMLFGTFHNPRGFETECGFERNLESRLGDMLKGIDLHVGAADERGVGS